MFLATVTAVRAPDLLLTFETNIQKFHLKK